MRSQEKRKKKKKGSHRSRAADALISLLLAEHFRTPKNISLPGRQAGRQAGKNSAGTCSALASILQLVNACPQNKKPFLMRYFPVLPPPPAAPTLSLSCCLCSCVCSSCGLNESLTVSFSPCCLASYRAQAHDIWQKHEAAKMKNERVGVHVWRWREGGRETGGGGERSRGGQMLLWYHTNNPHTHTHLPLWSINFMANPSADWVLKVKAPSLRVCKHDPAARPQRRTWPFKRALFIREPFLLNYSTGNPALPVSSLSFSSPSALWSTLLAAYYTLPSSDRPAFSWTETVALNCPPPPLQ